MKHRHEGAVAAIVALATLLDSEARSNGSPPARLGLAPFYEKYLDAEGLPIVSSAKVPDKALIEARSIVDHMLALRPDVRAEMIRAKVLVAVMARSEVTTDIPEHADLKPKAYWDARARGLGGTVWRPACSCAEENLLGYPDDRYLGESILVHEFGHTIHELGLDALEKTFDARLQRCYENAIQRHLFRNTYAARDYKEYWAEGVQSWFDANLEAIPANGVHNEINTRSELERYYPDLAKLIAEAFGANDWRWRQPRRAAKEGAR